MAENPLRVLIVTQYFWPENMRINDLAEDFVAKGHDVTVLTGVPNYPEGKVFAAYKENPAHYSHYAGAQIVRVPMVPRGERSLTLAFNYLSFFTGASILGTWKLRSRTYDVVFVYAVSPIMAAIPAILIGRLKRAATFVWILDLWPETLKAVGVVRNDRALALVGKMVSWIYNRTDYLLLQSRGFYDSVRQYCTREIAEERLVFFPSWAEDDFSQAGGAESDLISRDPSSFTIVFAGNVGDAQDFPAILEAAEATQDGLRVRWVIVGDGRASDWVKSQVSKRRLKNVLLLGRHPLAKMPPLFSQADALLVSLKTNEVFSRTIPGKVQAYLASGRPVIAMIDGEAARVITEAGAGMACASSDSNALAEIVKRMVQMPAAQREAMGHAGRRYYLTHYSKDRLLDQLETLFRAASLRTGG